jgi:hypothetical protein
MLAGLGAQAAFAIAERQGAALEARFAARRDNAAEAARFRDAAPRIADAEALLRDRRSLRLVLEAFQLESEIDKRGMLRRVLTENPAEEGSLASRLTDRRWRELGAAFAAERAANPGQPPLANPAFAERLLRNAMTNRFEKAMGEGNPGLREALYFRRMASTATSVPQLMADRALLEVARGANGIPQQFGLLSFEQQRDLITRRVDLPALQDPKAVSRLAQRYLALQPQQAAPAGQVAALFDNRGGAEGLIGLLGRNLRA